ncbi:FMRFamide peptide receptor frpr-18-like [Physella acuta]|uniref:FMRFamide peptide receptor frpr-18-like n=1 Tax=Physella acuta TaxID=109671 RepID=UPI0027DD2411|nr:FMRFamide peptide receptor frpr-18-like [Physella acuta]XP_059152931.1 FMRFamide peptide receptor frpr-18-like [Physella acuta]XP_059152932.1 FMRFamide peptide receptor frpr-18-like [Physella acuta]
MANTRDITDNSTSFMANSTDLMANSTDLMANSTELMANKMANYVFERYTPTGLLEVFTPAGQMVEKCLMPLFYFIGYIGNPLSAYIWLSQRMRRNNSSAIYLGALSISDLMFLMLHLLYYLHTVWGYGIYNGPVTCELFMVLFYAPQYLSSLLVLGFTAERYIAVCHPFMKEKWCTVWRAVVIVLCLAVFSLCVASVQGYIWTYNLNTSACYLREEAHDGNFWSVWGWCTEIPFFVLLPLLVLLLNMLVLREIYKISRNDLVNRQQTRGGGGSTASTVTLLAVSFFFIVTQLSATVANNLQPLFPTGDHNMTDDQIRQDSTWMSLFRYLEVKRVVDALCLSHYACYFLIYCCTGKHFRKEIYFLLTLHGRLANMVSRRRGREQYSMVSTNGGQLSETFTTNFSTTM